jgi:hypothetical protein
MKRPKLKMSFTNGIPESLGGKGFDTTIEGSYDKILALIDEMRKRPTVTQLENAIFRKKDALEMDMSVLYVEENITRGENMNFLDAIREAQKGKEIYRSTPIKNGTCRYLHLWDKEDSTDWHFNWGKRILGTRANTEVPLSDEDILAEDWEAVEYGEKR